MLQETDKKEAFPFLGELGAPGRTKKTKKG